MGDFIDNIEQDVESLFPPKPGGMVESARKQKANTVPPVAHEVESAKYLAVRVVEESALVAGANTIVVGTSDTSVQRVLGFDPNRKRATIITLDEPVVVGVSQQQANDPRNAANTAGNTAGGFVLPVNTLLVVESASEVWVAATSATKTRVSTFNETYGEQ